MLLTATKRIVGRVTASAIASARLAALHIRLHVGRRHQLHRVPEPGQLTAPVMSSGAGFHTDQAGPQPREEPKNLSATQLPAHHHPACRIDPMDLENALAEYAPPFAGPRPRELAG